MLELKNEKIAIPVVLFAGLLWSFGPLVVRYIDQADLVRQGRDVTILTYSRMRHHCLKAVEMLESKDIDVELIDGTDLAQWQKHITNIPQQN